jgi:hypothetical protein
MLTLRAQLGGSLGYVTEKGRKGVLATFRGHLAAIKLVPGFAGRLELGLYVKEFDAGIWLGNADSNVFAKTCAWLAELLLAPQCSTVSAGQSTRSCINLVHRSKTKTKTKH